MLRHKTHIVCVEEGDETRGMTAILSGLSRKVNSRTLEFHKVWTKADVTVSRATIHIKPLLNQRQSQKHVTYAKEKKN